jgi:nucleobase:cation symporter-1, NCS1 family
MATFLVLNSRGASVYHIGYPVYVRICAGLYGSLWFVFIRGIVAIFFMGTQSYYAGQLVSVMLRCVFANKWTDLHNGLSADAGITTGGITAFFIFWFVQLGFMFLHPSKSAWLYTTKSVICPPVLIATFAFVVGTNRGLGQTSNLGAAATSASVVGWAFMGGINSISGSLMTEVSSNPDLARYAKNSGATTWPQWFGLVVAKSLCTFLGIGASSAVKTLWGTAYWNIWDLYLAILDHNVRCTISSFFPRKHLTDLDSGHRVHELPFSSLVWSKSSPSLPLISHRMLSQSVPTSQDSSQDTSSAFP